jgi:hypothetical protein
MTATRRVFWSALEGRIEPGRVFDRTGTLDEVPAGYRGMNDRDVLKFQIAFAT